MSVPMNDKGINVEIIDVMVYSQCLRDMLY